MKKCFRDIHAKLLYSLTVLYAVVSAMLPMGGCWTSQGGVSEFGYVCNPNHYCPLLLDYKKLPN